MQNELPHLVRADIAAHPLRNLETVRTAFRQVTECVRKEPALVITVLHEFVTPCRRYRYRSFLSLIARNVRHTRLD